MWRSRRLQQRFKAQGLLSDCESLILDEYFDVAGAHVYNAEARQAIIRVSEAVSIARRVQAEVDLADKESQ